jgi:hypothetical protein
MTDAAAVIGWTIAGAVQKHAQRGLAVMLAVLLMKAKLNLAFV